MNAESGRMSAVGHTSAPDAACRASYSRLRCAASLRFGVTTVQPAAICCAIRLKAPVSDVQYAPAWLDAIGRGLACPRGGDERRDLHDHVHREADTVAKVLERLVRAVGVTQRDRPA